MLTDLDVLQMRINRGHDTIDALCHGRLRWEMRVPAEPDHDPDLILSDALRAGEQAIAELHAARKVAEAAGMIAEPVVEHVNEHGAGGYLLARLSGLRAALDEYAKVREGGQG